MSIVSGYDHRKPNGLFHPYHKLVGKRQFLSRFDHDAREIVVTHIDWDRCSGTFYLVLPNTLPL